MKKILITLLVTLISVGAMAQRGPGPGSGSGSGDGDKQNSKTEEQREHREKIRSMKIGYLTTQMSLSVEQSVDFWPLYNEYRRENHLQYVAIHKLQKKIRTGVATITDINQLLDAKAKLVTIDEEYVAKFERVISIDQIAKMFVAEADFKGVLLRTLNKGKK